MFFIFVKFLKNFFEFLFYQLFKKPKNFPNKIQKISKQFPNDFQKISKKFEKTIFILK